MERLKNVLGDIVVASGSIAYLGAYTNEYRESLYAQWREKLKSLGVRNNFIVLTIQIIVKTT